MLSDKEAEYVKQATLNGIGLMEMSFCILLSRPNVIETREANDPMYIQRELTMIRADIYRHNQELQAKIHTQAIAETTMDEASEN